MSKRPGTPSEVSSFFIPERELWTPEAAAIFLDDDGYIRKDKDAMPDFEPLPKPLISEDHPVVDIEAYAQAIRGLFRPDAKIPKIYRKDISAKLAINGIHATNDFIDIIVKDNREHAQQQKLYKEDGRIVDMQSFRFCDLADRSFMLQWLAHNAATEVFGDAHVPDLTAQADHVKGESLKNDLLDQAIIVSRRGQPFNLRLGSIRAGRVRPKSLEELQKIRGEEWDISQVSPEEIFEFDQLSKDHFRSLSAKAKDAWKKKVEEFTEKMPDIPYYAPLTEQIADAKPRAVIAILGTCATRDPWAFSPFFSNRMTIEQAKKAQRNRYIRRVAQESRLVA